jgi:hypothetical protein
MTIETTLLEQAFVKEEAVYGTLEAAPSATDGFRHQELTLEKKNNREPSPEKRGTPDRSQSLPRLTDSKWDLGAAFWEPSGVLGTQSYLSAFLKNGFGTRTLPALATTVAAAPAPTATGCTLTSAAGLAVGDCIVFTIAAGARREITRIKTLAGAAITYDALSAAPDTPGAAVSGVNYKLASSVPGGLSIYKYSTAGGFKESVSGAICTDLAFMIDGGKEVGITLGGPAKDWHRAATPAIPGAHTTVGSPASGLVGNLYVDGVAFLVLSATVTITDKSQLRRGELGTGGLATGIIPHADFREVSAKVTFYLEDTNLIGKAETVTRAVLRMLVGSVNGAMVGMVLPAVEFEIPTLPASGGPKIVTIDGVGYSGGLGNDQVFAGEI